jgi:hypothetical protein
MPKSRAPRAFKFHEGPMPTNIRESGAREQSRGLAIPRVEPSHQHNQARRIQSQKRAKQSR